MGPILIKLSPKSVFAPIQVEIKFSIDTQEELDSIKSEFKEGEFAHLTTAYSTILFELLTAVHNSTKRL